MSIHFLPLLTHSESSAVSWHSPAALRSVLRPPWPAVALRSAKRRRRLCETFLFLTPASLEPTKITEETFSVFVLTNRLVLLCVLCELCVREFFFLTPVRYSHSSSQSSQSKTCNQFFQKNILPNLCGLCALLGPPKLVGVGGCARHFFSSRPLR